MAVFIPLLLMGGIIGRLFREFAVTTTMCIGVSAFVALTLTPMMASRFLRSERRAKHGRFYQVTERGFDKMLRAYERGLDLVLRHQFTTLCVFLATLGATVYLFVIIPKGFFPQQDTGLITGISEAAAGRVVRRDDAAAGGAGRDHRQGPRRCDLRHGHRRGRLHVHAQQRPLLHHAEAQGRARRLGGQVIARLRPQLEKVEGARLFLQAAQDVNIGGRIARTQFQYTLQDANLDELNEWAPKVLEKLKSLPMLRDVASDQQTSGTALTLTIDRDQAARYGLTPQMIDDTLYDAFGQRQVAQYFTQQNSYHVVMEILPELQGEVDSLDKIYIQSPTTGQQVPLATFAKWTTRKTEPLSISHQGQFPAVTISFNLAQGGSLGTATEAIQQAEREMQMPPSLIGTFQGNAQAFQASLRTVPMLIVAALFVVYLILGILYESYIHPLTILSTLPSAGAGAIATLMLFGFDFSLVAMIGVILLIGIVKKNGIMMVDFAITAERDEHLSAASAMRKAALLRFRPIMMTTAAALLGGVPLMLGAGTGAEIRQPLGYAMVGGLVVSQALTLFTTPVIYIYLDRLSDYLSVLATGKQAHPEPASQSHAAE